MTLTFRLNRSFDRQRAHRAIDQAPEGWVAVFRPETRTDDQNRKLWPMLEDLRRQVPGLSEYHRDDIKLMFLNALKVEMRFLPALEGNGLFPVGLRSSTLTKEQFSALIELLYEYGARNGVVWTEPKEEAA